MLGNAFEKLKEQGKMDRLLLKTRVYARFSPQQKQEAVGLLINKGLVVGNKCLYNTKKICTIVFLVSSF
jgi:magnesium-transporting ATPase (P-type)